MSRIKIKISPDLSPRWNRELSIEDDIFIPGLSDPSYGVQSEIRAAVSESLAHDVGQIILWPLMPQPTELDNPAMLVATATQPIYAHVGTAA